MSSRSAQVEKRTGAMLYDSEEAIALFETAGFFKDQDLMQKCVIAIAVSLQRFGQNANSLATVLVR